MRPVEVQTAAVDAVPEVAAALADAFMEDPLSTWLLPGSLRLQAWLRTMFAAEMEQYVLPNGGTVWTTSGYDGAVTELPPTSERSGCVPRCKDTVWDQRSCSRHSREPTRQGHR
jgi:hypothetical protein